jgi:hypothetical protein
LILISLSASQAWAGSKRVGARGTSASSARQPTVSPLPANPNAKEYAAFIKAELRKDLQTSDVHLATEGTVKWLFVAIGYGEWTSMSVQTRRELVSLLLRHLKQTYPERGLKVSVGVDADQPLAEG